MSTQTVTLTDYTGRTVTLGSVTYTGGHAHGYTLDSADLSPAPRAPRQQALPLVGGGVVTPGRPGIRVVELAGTIVGRTATEANQLQAALAAIVADQGDSGFTSIRYTPDATLLELSGTLDGTARFEAQKGANLVRYSLRFVCPDPLAYSTTTRSVTAAGSPGTTFTVLGDANVWPTLTAVVASGTVTAITIGNSATGLSVQLTGLSLTTGKTITITTRPGYEAITVDGANGMSKRGTNSRWIYFRPGTNGFYATVTGGTATVTAAFRDGWAS